MALIDSDDVDHAKIVVVGIGRGDDTPVRIGADHEDAEEQDG